MIAAHAMSLDRLASNLSIRATTVPGSSPVPFFGRANVATIATVGINPSNREFEGPRGDQLADAARRFPTLDSVGLTSWDQVDTDLIRAMLESGYEYFARNPYDRWFRVLDRVLGRIPATYFGQRPSAFHLDLVPFATRSKWGSLGTNARKMLMDHSREIVTEVVSSSPADFLILNGAGVIQAFEDLAAVSLARTPRPAWDLAQRGDRVVRGESVSATITSLAGRPLRRPTKVVGFNINLQSSFGVTTVALDAVADYLAAEYRDR